MDSSREELSSPPSKPAELPYAATLTCAAQRDARSPRLQHLDLLARHHSSSKVSQSNPDLFAAPRAQAAGEIYLASQWADDFNGTGPFIFYFKGVLCDCMLPLLLGTHNLHLKHTRCGFNYCHLVSISKLERD